MKVATFSTRGWKKGGNDFIFPPKRIFLVTWVFDPLFCRLPGKKTSRFMNIITRSSFKSPAMINEPADAQNIFADVIADLPPPPWPDDPKVGL